MRGRSLGCSGLEFRPVFAHFVSSVVCCIVLLAASVRLTADEPKPRGKTTASGARLSFENDVRPILVESCHACHGADTQESQLDLRTLSEMLRGGELGPSLVRGRPDESLLFKMIASGKMPPDEEDKLTASQIATIRRWIEAGAPATETIKNLPPRQLVSQQDRRFLTFRNLTRPNPPSVKQTERIRTSIDAFVLAKLESKNLSYSGEADRRVLVRRAYFDLIGLPPSPQQVDDFLVDQSSHAYERLIDKLLASHHFGERWGRHWLDAGGYVDVYGSDENAPTVRLPPGGWRYRDYVVRSLNQDKPYDRFLLEQIAGDELVDWRSAAVFTPEIKELLIATGFLRTAIDDTDQDVLNIPSNRFATIFDQMQIFGSSVLGLTLQCARCHSHKFDPIPQRDYYRLMANFTPAYNPQSWVKLNDRTLPDVSSAEKSAIEKHNAEIDAQVKKRNDEVARIKQIVRERLFERKLADLDKSIRADVKAAVTTPAEKRNDGQKQLVAQFEPALKIGDEQVTAALSGQEKEQTDRLTAEIASLNSRRQSWGFIQALYDTGPPAQTHLLTRGEFDNPGREVKHGFLSVLSLSDSDALASVSNFQGKTSGRRLALAQWLTKPDTPAGSLVARVMVNRVWHHLFGRGIVKTPGNLGHSGAKPTHPQMLDWLASEFVQNGWRIKPLIKLMMTSTVYRQKSIYEVSKSQAAVPRDDPLRIDPDNSLLWRMRLRRLNAEAIRDSILVASGKLDRTTGGPPVPIKLLPGGMIVVETNGLPTPTAQWRRSLYLTSRRNYNISMLSVFDMPVITTNCSVRNKSAVVLQSLTMLNDQFILEQSAHFAKRVVHTAGKNQQQQIELSYQIAMARKPTIKETKWSSEFLNDQSAAFRKAKFAPDDADRKSLNSFCQMLLNSSHFLYVQ